MPKDSHYTKLLANAAKLRANVLKLHRNGRGLSQADIGRKLQVSRQRVQQIVAQSTKGRK